MRLKSKLLFVNVPAESPGAISKFYSDFFGIPLARSLTERPESYHAPIDEDGIDLNVTERQHPGEMLTCYFGVDNLDEAITTLQNQGARVNVATGSAGQRLAFVSPRATHGVLLQLLERHEA